jgi:hypothetical protein
LRSQFSDSWRDRCPLHPLKTPAQYRASASRLAKDIKPTQLRKILAPVDAFYGFWHNGSAALLDKGLLKDFVDHTLPPGRPQGSTGPAIASKGFLAAVPDL